MRAYISAPPLPLSLLPAPTVTQITPLSIPTLLHPTLRLLGHGVIINLIMAEFSDISVVVLHGCCLVV